MRPLPNKEPSISYDSSAGLIHDRGRCDEFRAENKNQCRTVVEAKSDNTFIQANAIMKSTTVNINFESIKNEFGRY